MITQGTCLSPFGYRIQYDTQPTCETNAGHLLHLFYGAKPKEDGCTLKVTCLCHLHRCCEFQLCEKSAMPLHLPTNSDSLSLKGLNQSSDFFERVLSSLLSHYPHGCQTPNATPRCCTLGILVLLFWLCHRGGCSPALYSHDLAMGMHVIIFTSDFLAL